MQGSASPSVGVGWVEVSHSQLTEDEYLGGPGQPVRLRGGQVLVIAEVMRGRPRGEEDPVMFLSVYPPGSDVGATPGTPRPSPTVVGWQVTGPGIYRKQFAIEPGRWHLSVQKGGGYAVSVRVYEEH